MAAIQFETIRLEKMLNFDAWNKQTIKASATNKNSCQSSGLKAFPILSNLQQLMKSKLIDSVVEDDCEDDSAYLIQQLRSMKAQLKKYMTKVN